MNISDYNHITPNTHPDAFLNGKRIIYLDASALSSSNGCFRALFFNCVCGLRHVAGRKSSALFFGSACHKFIAELYRGSSLEASMDKAITYYSKPECQSALELDDFLTTTKLETVCKKYYKQIHQPNILRLKPVAVELPFRIPIAENHEYVVILVGTIDLLGEYPNGTLAICDHKTSSRKMANMDHYHLSLQLALYSIAIKRMSATILGRPGATSPACLINHLIINKTNTYFFQSTDISFDTEYLGQLEAYVDTVSRQFLSGELPYYASQYGGFLTGNCQKLYGNSCTFFDLCRPDMRQLHKDILNGVMFNTNFYNPLTFGDASE